MKKTISRFIAVFCIALLSIAVFALQTAAVGMSGNVGNNGMGGGEGDRAGIDSGSPSDTTMYEGNIDSGTDGRVGDESGTGEFGVDTPKKNSDTTEKNPVAGAADDIVRGTEDAVENVTGGGIGVWGVIIAVLVIIAIIVLIFAFFSKKK